MSWQIVIGVVEWWADEGLRDLGRRSSQATNKTPADEPIALGTTDLARAAFIAQRHPWRLTELSLGDTNEHSPAAIVSWADDATAVLQGQPAQLRPVEPNESWGDLGVRRMLEPGPLETVMPKPWASQFQLNGETLEGDRLTVLPEFVSLSSDQYRATYDADLDVLTTWEAIIDGAVAQRISLTYLTAIEVS